MWHIEQGPRGSHPASGHRVMSLAMANPNRVSGGWEEMVVVVVAWGGGGPGLGSSAFTKPGPPSCDWDHNSSEQGYGIFNEYGDYWWGGEGRGEKSRQAYYKDGINKQIESDIEKERKEYILRGCHCR